MAKIGRNEPCPCGSGRKYKQCCMGKEENGLTLRLPPLQSVSRKGGKSVYSFVDLSDPVNQADPEIRAIMLGEGEEELTDELIAELAGRGWQEADLKRMRADGAMYNRIRDSIVYPPEAF